ncbi:MAG: recombinase family protein, partial [Planctomycetales bacterium]|nr:recombinase family protein [Planctomycetales bacterium]
MAVAIYARVSSRQQDTRSQEADLRRWAKTQTEEVRWYRDTATGRKMDRPGWNRLTRDISKGKVKRVVCWRLDRLGRTASGLSALFQDWLGRGVTLISLRDGLDLSTPSGRLMAHVLASVAQYENEVRVERVMAGQARARAAGVSWGGSERGRRIKVTDEQVATIKRMARDGAKKAVI